MCPSPLGRVQTRTMILIIPAIIGAILSLITGNEGYVVIIGLYYLIGVALDLVFYPLIIKWQPPWLTFVLAVGEFILTYIAAQVLDVGLTPVAAVIWFWVAWTLAIWIKVVILPLMFLTWVENGGEIRAADWSVQPEYEPYPIQAAPVSNPGEIRLVREFSAVNQLPSELQNLPAPSGVHARPQVG